MKATNILPCLSIVALLSITNVHVHYLAYITSIYLSLSLSLSLLLYHYSIHLEAIVPFLFYLLLWKIDLGIGESTTKTTPLQSDLHVFFILQVQKCWHSTKENLEPSNLAVISIHIGKA